MDRPGHDARVEAVLAWCGRVSVLLVLVVAALSWAGWATGIDQLTGIYPDWPPMMPWTAVCLAVLCAAILAQSGRPSRGRVWAGRGLAVVAGAVAGMVLAEYATGRAFGLDQIWFSDAARMVLWNWPGRPSSQTAASVLLLAAAAALLRVDRGTRVVWPACIAAAGSIAFVTVGAYLFNALALVGFSASNGQALLTALALLLLAVATSIARPDRAPLAWLLARPDRRSLLRLVGILAGFPVVVALSRVIFLGIGLGEHAEWSFSVLLGTVIVGAVAFFSAQREQILLIEKEQVSRERADAEMRYRILADNAVDIIVHLRGGEVAWISPSVEAALGGPVERWAGSKLGRRIHPDDREALVAALSRVTRGESVLQRFRVRSVDGYYHWVDGHGKRYVDAAGNVDGLIAALRIVDDQVAAEQRLERLARFDTLTGLVNRAEAIRRLESALQQPRPLGTYVGVLFCDVDHFKDVNDTWGHVVGDQVLAKLSARVRDSVRPGDTVGRTGGDEILVLLPGIHGIDEVAEIAEQIRRRAAEPIHVSGKWIRATLSIGATLAFPGEAVSSITTRADAAMYRAKLGDRNAVIRI